MSITGFLSQLLEIVIAIALVGLFALARVFISLAAMDIGTAFGTMGARREMLIGFLAEPALLMVRCPNFTLMAPIQGPLTRAQPRTPTARAPASPFRETAGGSPSADAVPRRRCTRYRRTAATTKKASENGRA